MATLIKGAQHANHELTLQLEAERQKYVRLKQSIAEEKVVIVDAEEKATKCLEEKKECEFELKTCEKDAEADRKVLEDELEVARRKVDDGLGEIDGIARAFIDGSDDIQIGTFDEWSAKT